MSKKRNAAEVRQIIEDFQRSGVTRGEFCRRRHMAVSTLDYWRRVQSKRAGFVEVAVASSELGRDFAVCLTNGRRIESGWRFSEAELARLIRIAESA